jgi:hypothetical protein
MRIPLARARKGLEARDLGLGNFLSFELSVLILESEFFDLALDTFFPP